MRSAGTYNRSISHSGIGNKSSGSIDYDSPGDAAGSGAFSRSRTMARQAIPPKSGSSPLSILSAPGPSISSAFDGGNIEVVDLHNPDAIQLRIKKDPYNSFEKMAHSQWFNFRVSGVSGKELKLAIVNAGEASYPFAWKGYQTCASYDLVNWFRVPTHYDKISGHLTIRHTPERDCVQYAYFAPYSLQRQQEVQHKLQAKDGVRMVVIGQTLDGRDMELMVFGEDKAAASKRKVWVIARQHPGGARRARTRETQASWFMEGLMERLSDTSDAVARKLLTQAVVYYGSYRGHLRTNAAGINLNRMWANPSQEQSPEVYHALQAMQYTGVDMLVDVHADEELPHTFVACNEGIPGYTPRLQNLEDFFCEAFMRASPEFQITHGYGKSSPGKANLALCSKQIGQQFDCMAMTLEMPFKDCEELPDPIHGYTPERASRLGAAMLTAVNEIVPKLR
eukprot:gene17880-24271_t